MNEQAKKQCMNCPVANFTPTTLTTLSGNLTGQFRISANITLSGNTTITDAEILLDPTVRIIVPSGMILRINHSHLFGCTNLWDEISIQNGGQIIIDNNSLIEDAGVAINFLLPVGTANTNTIISVKNSIFNKNLYGIRISNYQNTSGNYPFTVENCVFTCRKLPRLLTSGLTTNQLKSPNNPISSVLQTPFINSHLYQCTNILPTLYPNGQQTQVVILSSFVAIQLMHVGVTTGMNFNSATNNPIYQEITIGSGVEEEYNVIDNHIRGIYAINSNFTCYNTVFQNDKSCVLDLGLDRVGVWAISAKNIVNNRCRIIPFTDPNSGLFVNGTHNRFYNCRRGVDTRDYLDVNIVRASFRSTQQSSNLINREGEWGFRGRSNRFFYYRVLEDTFYNIANPINFTATLSNPPLQGTTNMMQYTNIFDVGENLIMPHPFAPPQQEYINNAITLRNTILNTAGGANSLAFGSSNILRVYNNRISDVYRGIDVQNWREKVVIIDQNEISLAPQVNTIGNQFGIQFIDNLGTTFFNGQSFNKWIWSNNITGFGLNPNTWGIRVSTDVNNLSVKCNNTQKTQRGIEFNAVTSAAGFPGSFTNIVFKNNIMQNHQWGYVLSNASVIGQQGDINTPSDNQWLGTWGPANGTFMTNCINSVSGNSILWVRDIAGFNPNFMPSSINGLDFNTSIPLNSGNEYLFANGSLPTVAILPSPETCPPTNPNRVALSPISAFEEIAEELYPYTSNIAINQYSLEYQLFQTLASQPEWRDSSTILDNFYLEHQNVGYGKVYDIMYVLGQGEWETAESLISNFSPQNVIENNFKTYFSIYNKIQRDSLGLNQSDSVALFNLALLCTEENGKIIYEARNLYNLYYETNYQFVDSCNLPNSGNRYAKIKSESNTFFIYPNPTANNIHLSLNKSEGNLYNITIRDIQGKIIENYSNKVIASEVTLQTNLTTGIYFVNILNLSTNENHVQKLIIHP